MKELDKYELSVLSMMKMKDVLPSTSPKLEKQTEPGDDDPCDHPDQYRYDEAQARLAGPHRDECARGSGTLAESHGDCWSKR